VSQKPFVLELPAIIVPMPTFPVTAEIVVKPNSMMIKQLPLDQTKLKPSLFRDRRLSLPARVIFAVHFKRMLPFGLSTKYPVKPTSPPYAKLEYRHLFAIALLPPQPPPPFSFAIAPVQLTLIAHLVWSVPLVSVATQAV
jgi:hypothetical protein